MQVRGSTGRAWRDGGEPSAQRRRALLLAPAIGVVLACVLAPLPALAPTPAAAAAGGDPVVHTPAPAPGSLVPDGEVLVRAHARGGEAIDSAALTVDGEPVTAVAIERVDERWGTAVSATVELAPGEHVARLEVADAAGRRAARTWRFTTTDRRVRRIAGDTRVETATAVSAAGFPAARSAGAAVLARAEEFADALAGAPLARSLDAPLLLAGTDVLPEPTAQELRRVLPAGATVHLLGGETALGPQVARAVRDLGFGVVRHAGEDRFATAAAIARALPPSDGAIVVSGEAFPDALAASVPAARDGLPVLLTRADRLHPAAAAALADRDVALATVVGGTDVVSAGVEAEVRGIVGRVARVAGEDRYATAVAVLAAWFEEVDRAVLASGVDFPDALAGTPLAADRDEPLLLSGPRTLASSTAEAVRSHQPQELTALGGPAALGREVVDAALRAAVDGPAAPRLLESLPDAAVTVSELDVVTVRLDRPVEEAETTLYVEVGGLELLGSLSADAGGQVLTLHLPDPDPPLPIDVREPGRVVVSGAGRQAVGRHEVGFAYLRPDPVFATTGPVALHLPSRAVELVGFHQSGHDGAQDLSPRDTATPKVTMASRGRGTGLRTSADIVADPAREVLAPVTGRVLRAGTYVLYCRYTDEFAVIEPDARPGWEVKVLHVRGLGVKTGDRVVADRTVVAAAPRALPFPSQVDEHSGPQNWPHVHVEVVDPSIPTRPGPGC